MAKKALKENQEEIKEQPVVEEQEEVQDAPKKKNRKEVRKEKKLNKFKKSFFNPVDIKYQGPLSYRYLRILAWVTLAAGQLLILNTIGRTLTGWNTIPQNWQTVISTVSSLSTPFFIIASFGLILSNQKNYKNVLATYGAAFIGMGAGITLFYYRYINGLFVKLGLEETTVLIMIKNFLGDKVQINVFADLFAFACFHFFLNYTPKKFFQGKKLYFFRSLIALPLIFVVASYVIKIIISLSGKTDLPFYVYPFLTTKSPIVFSVFALAAVWIKNRERLFVSLGATREEYKEYLKTNRNSLAFSLQLSLIFLSSLALELTLLLFLAIYYIGVKHVDGDMFGSICVAYQSGGSLSLLLAIPFILLYSYTRGHKNNLIDLFIPIIGISLIILVYVEGVYQLIINTMGL